MKNHKINLLLDLENAYNNFTDNKINQSIDLYNQALKHTDTSQSICNIELILTILYQMKGDYMKSQQLMNKIEKNINKNVNKKLLIKIYSNFTLIQILNGNYNTALDYFQQLLTVIQNQENQQYKEILIKFATFLFFRVENINQISDKFVNINLHNARLQQIYCIWLFTFNSSLLKNPQQQLQVKCCQFFVKFQRYDLAALTLRSLIKFSNQKQKYRRQLNKFRMMGLVNQQLDFQNYQPYDVVQCIADQFVLFNQRLQKINATSNNNDFLLLEWKLVINLMNKQLINNKKYNNQTYEILKQTLSSIKKEQNIQVICDMIKTAFFQNYLKIIKPILAKFQLFNIKSIKSSLQQIFNILKKQPLQEKNKNNLFQNTSHNQSQKTSIKSSKIIISKKQKDQKQNHPLGISIVSNHSSKHQKQRKKIFQQDNYSLKQLHKMVKFIQYGGFLNKRNFNSDGGQFKYVKINSSFIKWGKDPQRIDKDCNMYPLKDIKSIVYGRVTPNMNTNGNKMLSYSKCFSLVLQKRTLDFYCKDYKQLMCWICGLTYVLKKNGAKLVGYTPAKLRWKIMFAILKQNFIQPLKTPQKNKYYFQNAYSLALFAKNNYQLPAKK